MRAVVRVGVLGLEIFFLLLLACCPQLSAVACEQLGQLRLGRRPAMLGCAPDTSAAVIEEAHPLQVAARPAEAVFNEPVAPIRRRHLKLRLGEALPCEHSGDDLLIGPAIADIADRAQGCPEHVLVGWDAQSLLHRRATYPTDGMHKTVRVHVGRSQGRASRAARGRCVTPAAATGPPAAAPRCRRRTPASRCPRPRP
jgi:hypothetical protein